MSNPTTHSLVAASDIAELAGVSRAAVSNWRRRHQDFPAQAAGSKAKPLFNLSDVTTWLRKQGHSVVQVPAEAKVWTALNSLRSVLTTEQAAHLVIALVAARAMGSDAPVALGDPSTLSSASDTGQDQAVRDRIAQVRQVIDSFDESELATVVDVVLERTDRAGGRTGGDHGLVDSRTSHLLASVASTHPGGLVYDPACGIASTLLELADAGRFDTYVGNEINEYALAIAELRAALRGVPLQLENADVLRDDPDPALRADVVIVEPSFGMRMDTDARLTDRRFTYGPPPRTSAETGWIQHAIAHLGDHGRAYVITPMGSLFRGPEGRIRAELLRHGCIESVVSLPGRMLPHTAIPLALWVLRRPNGDHADVLLIDASTHASPEKYVAEWLSDDSSLEAVPHVRVSVDRLIGDDAQLTPQRWLAIPERSAQDVQADFTRAAGSVREATRLLGADSNSIRFSPAAPARMITIQELIREGVVEHGRSFALRNGSDELKERAVNARAVLSGNLPEPLAREQVPNDVELTQPADILVLTHAKIRAVVDEVGGHLLAPTIERLRILKPEVADPHYVAAMLGGSWNGRFLAGSTIQRAKLGDLEIPLGPMSDQKSVLEGLREAERIRQAGIAVIESSESLASTLLDAVRVGTALDSATLDE